MANKKKGQGKALYIILIVLFSVLFFISMAVCFIWHAIVAKQCEMRTIKYRQDAIELEMKISGPEHIFSSLYFDNDYEEEFDQYWPMANARVALIRGRFGDDRAAQIAYIEEIKNSVSNEEYKAELDKYLEILNTCK